MTTNKHLPGRIQELRYAHNPADFAFSWGSLPVPVGISVIGLQPTGTSTPVVPILTIDGSTLVLSLSAAQMGQVFTFPDATQVLEIRWGGLIQIVLAVKASLTVSSGPGRDAITVALPPAVTYLVQADMVAAIATQAATQAFASKTTALDAAQTAITNAQASLEFAERAEQDAQLASQDRLAANQAAQVAVDAAGNIMTFNGLTQYGAKMGIGGSILYTLNNNRYHTATITLL